MGGGDKEGVWMKRLPLNCTLGRVDIGEGSGSVDGSGTLDGRREVGVDGWLTYYRRRVWSMTGDGNWGVWRKLYELYLCAQE